MLRKLIAFPSALENFEKKKRESCIWTLVDLDSSGGFLADLEFERNTVSMHIHRETNINLLTCMSEAPKTLPD